MLGWGAAGLSGRAARDGRAAAARAAGRWRSRAALPGLAVRRLDGPVHADAASPRRPRPTATSRSRRCRCRSTSRTRSATCSLCLAFGPALRAHAGAVPPPAGRALAAAGDRSRRGAAAGRVAWSRAGDRLARVDGVRSRRRCAIWSAPRTATAASAARPARASSQLITGLDGARAGGRRAPSARRAAAAGATPIDYMRGGHRRAVGDRRAGAHDPRPARRGRRSARRFGGRDLLADLLAQAAARTDRSGASSNWTAFGIMAAARVRALGRARPRCAARPRGLRASRTTTAASRSRRAEAAASSTRPAPPCRGWPPRAGGRSRAVTRARGVPAQGAEPRRRLRPDRRATARTRSRPPGRCRASSAAGRAPAPCAAAGRSPLRYLASLQQPDGSFRYSRTSAQTPVWVTAQASAALRRKAFPVRPRRARSAARRRASPPPARAAGRPTSRGGVKEQPRARPHRSAHHAPVVAAGRVPRARRALRAPAERGGRSRGPAADRDRRGRHRRRCGRLPAASPPHLTRQGRAARS